jgi:hypothetical protein
MVSKFDVRPIYIAPRWVAEALMEPRCALVGSIRHVVFGNSKRVTTLERNSYFVQWRSQKKKLMKQCVRSIGASIPLPSVVEPSCGGIYRHGDAGLIKAHGDLFES